MTTRTYQSEFGKDFNLGINLEGWTDNSWKNDVCPCFTRDDGDFEMPCNYRLWVDFEKLDDRESLLNDRYTLEIQFTDKDDNQEWNVMWAGESPSDIQTMLDIIALPAN